MYGFAVALYLLSVLISGLWSVTGYIKLSLQQGNSGFFPFTYFGLKK